MLIGWQEEVQLAQDLVYRTRPFAPIYACFVVCCMPSVAHGIQCADSQGKQ